MSPKYYVIIRTKFIHMSWQGVLILNRKGEVLNTLQCRNRDVISIFFSKSLSSQANELEKPIHLPFSVCACAHAHRQRRIISIYDNEKADK